jgi:hypothetical protein
MPTATRRSPAIYGARAIRSAREDPSGLTPAQRLRRPRLTAIRLRRHASALSPRRQHAADCRLDRVAAITPDCWLLAERRSRVSTAASPGGSGNPRRTGRTSKVAQSIIRLRIGGRASAARRQRAGSSTVWMKGIHETVSDARRMGLAMCSVWRGWCCRRAPRGICGQRADCRVLRRVAANRGGRWWCGFVALLVALLAGAPAAGASGWSVRRLPGPRYTSFSAVSCRSSSACIAVGGWERRPGYGFPLNLVERWNGSRWSLQPAPEPSVGLFDLSCPSAHGCQGVGARAAPDGSRMPVAERWNGSGWSVETLPPSGDGALYGISCSSGWACTAVGWRDDGGTLIDRWNGRSWFIQATPPNGGGLNAVSCPSATTCIAVGAADCATGGCSPLAQHWDGRRWIVDLVGGNGELDNLSCASRFSCVAIDTADAANTIGYLNGTRWTVGVENLSLVNVSCPSVRTCIGVSSGLDRSLIYRRTGARWHNQFTAPPLDAVSCPSANVCVAVGEDGKGPIAAQLNAG